MPGRPRSRHQTSLRLYSPKFGNIQIAGRDFQLAATLRTRICNSQTIAEFKKAPRSLIAAPKEANMRLIFATVAIVVLSNSAMSQQPYPGFKTAQSKHCPNNKSRT